MKRSFARVVFAIFALLLSTGLCVSRSTVAVAQVANPAWPSQCPLKLALMVDQSTSMTPRFDAVRDAARNVVDALRDKHSEVTLIGFGSGATVVTPLVDVADTSARDRLKNSVDDLGPLSGWDGGTNWEAALTTVRKMSVNVAVLLTDGEPTEYDTRVPGVGGEAEMPLAAAVVAADQLKASGTRLVAVGIELDAGAADNLAKITGPVQGQDYYPSDLTNLLHQLYAVIASACGVPVSTLPAPEPPSFPLARTVLGALAVLCLAALVGFLLHRRRRVAVPKTSGPTPIRVVDPTISHDDVLKRLGIGDSGVKPTESTQAAENAVVDDRTTPDAEKPETSQPARRSMSLDFLREDRGGSEEKGGR
ncbi:VWA domain-containing protein [Solihabitans fulvus]|uniref:VWA domain-containing protein n=1 Tax=Solihabitans fulvus TaxID=1892852 RepID=A0A5B2XEC1_9PSEU|nr:vWA domain-containing protein [Solihabitans fulvus]KAA2261290.1 VWA domain-containing protein [Solihabitans fulvus]